MNRDQRVAKKMPDLLFRNRAIAYEKKGDVLKKGDGGTGVIFGLIAIIKKVFVAFLGDQWAVECAILVVAPRSFPSTARPHLGHPTVDLR